jgi:hypothetical protein
MQGKVTGPGAENTNTNFGRDNKAARNNVWHWLKTKLGKEIICVGCDAHIVHNCMQLTLDGLLFNTESFAVNM